ncbi:nicotinate phosphoribosyltransferase [Blattabacterium cuenoti]|uniref:nicotinate phosphoribosyltransferase n=1 Tax=Blattabacterium cuenoti TaxID=1653831 RepID=UPI00163B8CCC|nr:nicotinate phosphoribosyltransferase [Blattabacterium cuenoti]
MNIPIISSLLDNDFYKFTMQNAVLKLFPNVKVQYKFINRGSHCFPKHFGEILKEILSYMQNLKLTNQERLYLEQYCPCFDSFYLNFLTNYRFDPKEITIIQKYTNIKIYIEGLWSRTILWEVPLLALISELYYKLTYLKHISYEKIIYSTIKKLIQYQNLDVKIGEYGTRRRFSYKVHKIILKILNKKKYTSFIGSSNLHFSKNFSIKPIGTQGHEWIMFHAAKYGFYKANKFAMINWINIYKHKLYNIALSDTYTSPLFFKNFNKKLSNQFEGIRHDSGDPFIFINNTLKHYNKFKINPLNKTIIFSDNLNPNKVANISFFCKKKINTLFCIGTNFTNDVGVPFLNIVIKIINTQYKKNKWIYVVKLSDNKTKSTGDKNMIMLAKKIVKKCLL